MKLTTMLGLTRSYYTKVIQSRIEIVLVYKKKLINKIFLISIQIFKFVLFLY